MTEPDATPPLADRLRAIEPFHAVQVFRDCFDAGVIVRTTGDTIAFSPPLIIDEAEIGQVVDTLRKALRA